MTNLFHSSVNDWSLLLTKANFTDDTDYAGTNTVPTAVISVPNVSPAGIKAQKTLNFIVIALDSSGAPVARGSDTFDLQLVEVLRPQHHDVAIIQQTFVADTATVEDTTYNRKITVESAGGEYTVRLSNFSGTPTNAVSLRVYFKVS